jgi:hypothetical protein
MLWGHAYVDQRLQRRAGRLTGFTFIRLTHCKPMFARLSILTAYRHYMLACILHAFWTIWTSSITSPDQTLGCSQGSTVKTYEELFHCGKIHNKPPNSLETIDKKTPSRWLVEFLNSKRYSFQKLFDDPPQELSLATCYSTASLVFLFFVYMCL